MNKRNILLSLIFLGLINAFSYYENLQVSGDYVLATVDNKVQVIKISQLPDLTLWFEKDFGTAISSAAASGDILFLASIELQALVSVDIGDTSNVQILDTITVPGAPLDVVVDGDYAYIASGSQGLQIVNISNPGDMVLAGGVDTESSATDVVVKGNTVYLASGKIYSIDVTQPAAPRIMAEGANLGLTNLDVVGENIYTARGHLGVTIFNTSNLEVRVGGYNLCGSCISGVDGVEGFGKWVFVSYYENGLRVLDISDPASPINTKTILEGMSTDGIIKAAVAGDYVISMAIASGLRVHTLADLTLSDSDKDAAIVKAILAENGLTVGDISHYVTHNDNGRILTLNLSGLGLTVISDTIAGLTALTALDLSNNKIASLPARISGLTGLRSLYLQNNMLSALPKGMNNISLYDEYQVTEYGCQIMIDGSCARWGNVLVTKTDTIDAEFGGNLLCSLDETAASWADIADPEWQLGQYLDENKNTRCDGSGIWSPGEDEEIIPIKIALQSDNVSTKLIISRPLRNARVSIFNLSGKELAKWENVNSKTITWNTENVSAGFYQFRIRDNSNIYYTNLRLNK